MGSIVVQGSLQGGPPGGGDVFPAATFNTPLRTAQSPKGFQSASGILKRTVSSPGAFIALSAVGVGQDVPQADFFYLRSDGALQLRLTNDDGVGGTTVQIVQVFGLFIVEFPNTLQLQLAEVQGNAQIEYFASGPA